MSDDRLESANLLMPEVKSPETAAKFESGEKGGEVVEGVKGVDVVKGVEKAQLSNLKASVSTAAQLPDVPLKDPVLQAIENILSANLGEIYTQLPEDKRGAFKAKGEEIAGKIQGMIASAKLKVHEILKMISAWLGMIPNVNIYFLRQEAKIKLDKVLDYAEQKSETAV